MTLDPDVVRVRCEEIEQSLIRLRRIATMGEDAFLADADARDIACYRLLIAIEAALALCYHVSARDLRAAPEDYAGCFVGLERAGIVDGELSVRLQRMARFRNLLVHVYWNVDYRRVYALLQRDVEDIGAFAGIIAARL